MCLGIPGKIVELLPDVAFPSIEGATPSPADAAGLRRGIVDFGGVRKEICLSCVDDVAVGAYVIVHVGFAISKVDPEEAGRIFAMIDEIEKLGFGMDAEAPGSA